MCECDSEYNPQEHVGFLFLNLILNEAQRLKQKSSEQAAETELMNGFFVNGSIFENACARRSRLTFSARLKHFEGGSEEASETHNMLLHCLKFVVRFADLS